MLWSGLGSIFGIQQAVGGRVLETVSFFCFVDRGTLTGGIVCFLKEKDARASCLRRPKRTAGVLRRLLHMLL